MCCLLISLGDAPARVACCDLCSGKVAQSWESRLTSVPHVVLVQAASIGMIVLTYMSCLCLHSPLMLVHVTHCLLQLVHVTYCFLQGIGLPLSEQQLMCR
jgi:hypothetical protein